MRGKHVITNVDNAGSVYLWNKGWSKNCNLGNTNIRAVYLVETALNCDFWFKRIGRCSSLDTETVDTLSMYDYKMFLFNMLGVHFAPRVVPRALLRWMEIPRLDRKLGKDPGGHGQIHQAT
jgi:hypothetical protein